MRLTIAVLVGIGAARLTSGWFGGMELVFNSVFGWHPSSLPTLIYGQLLMLLTSSVGAFVSALLFRRYELFVACLTFVVDRVVVLTLIGSLPLLRGFGDESYVTAWLVGLSTIPESAVMLVGDALLFSAFGAWLAWILRKYRAARAFGTASEAMPPRWAFELGGGIVCVTGVFLGVFQIAIGVIEWWHLKTSAHGGNWAVFMLLGGLFAAAWFARLIPFGRRVMRTKLYLPDTRHDVLLLRAFDDDQRPAFESDNFVWAELVEAQRGRFLTERVMSLLAARGRVLALGAPDEIVGAGVAAQPYFAPSTDEWQDYVRNAIAAAKVVVVIVNDSPGLRWEVEQIVATGALTRTIFFVPASIKADQKSCDREARLKALRDGVAMDLQADEGQGLVVLPQDDLPPRVTVAEPGHRAALELLRETVGSCADAAGIPLPEETLEAEALPASSMSWSRLMTPDGRLNRTKFVVSVLSVVAALAVSWVAMDLVLAQALPHMAPGLVSTVQLLFGYCFAALGLLGLWVTICLAAQRMHDFGRPAWHLVEVPLDVGVIGPVIDIWMLSALEPYYATWALAAYCALTLSAWPGDRKPNAYGVPGSTGVPSADYEAEPPVMQKVN